MSNKNIVETFIGGIVLSVAIGFGFYAYEIHRMGQEGHYVLNAQFDRIDGIVAGSDVRVSGVKVGEVTSQILDNKTYMAKLTFTVDENVLLPKDSSAEIIGGSFFGNKYLAVVPGNEEEMLQSGNFIRYTQSSISIESLIGKFIFQNSSKDHNAPAPASDNSSKKE